MTLDTPPKKRKTWVTVLIVLGAIVALSIPVCGVLGAIAVPAFLRSVKKSKTSESAMTLVRLQSAAEYSWQDTCEFPPAFAPTAQVGSFCGGAKTGVNFSAKDAFAKYSATLPDPSYFAYSGTLEEDAEGNKVYRIRAQADFNCGGEVHTTEVVVVGKKDESGSCTAESQPSVTMYEFE